MNVRTVGAVLLCAACQPAGSGDEHGESAALEQRVAALTDELARSRARAEADHAQIAGLQAELDRATSARVARESEWLRYTRAIADMGARADVTTPSFQPDAAASAAPAAGPASDEPVLAASVSPDATAEAAVAAARTATRAERDHAIFLGLRSLFAAERVLVFDLLETGTLHDGATGPVVMRTLDANGRPTGAVCAARLRLEASRAARTLTLVLEDGYERRGTVKLPFEGATEAEADGADTTHGGVRRIVLPEVDPNAWIEALPELFGEQGTEPPPDDGHWNLLALRNELNLLLREDAEHGWWRLAGIGGVRGTVLCDVSLDQLDREGRLERKLFADRLSVLREDRGLQLYLESGAQVRGDTKIPFLDGRFRIFLPRADVAAWTSRGVPGLSPAPR